MKRKALFKEFLQYVSLNVCGMIGLSCYILADTFFVAGGLGADGLTALNLAIPVYSFVHGCGLMLGMGGATKYSILRGQGEERRGNMVFSNALCAAAVLASAFMLAGICFAGQLARTLGADGEVYGMTKTYLKVILLFAPAFMANDILSCFVRNDGSPKLSMAAMLIGSLSNIVMDYLLIFPLKMGILGAVLATGFAPVISMCILSRHRIRGKSNFHLMKPKIFDNLTNNILSLGVPSLITEVASGIVMIVFNFIILGIQGNMGVAAYGIVANLSLVIISVYTGIAQGMQPIMSRAYGRDEKEDIVKVLRYGICSVLLMSCIIYLVFLFGADPIAGVFNREGNVQLQQTAVAGLRLYFTAIVFIGFNIVIATYFTSMERAFPAQVISLARGFFVIIPVAFILSYAFGMTGVWLSYPVTECVVSAMGMAFYRRFDKIV